MTPAEPGAELSTPRPDDAWAAAALLAVDPGLGACIRSVSSQAAENWAAAVALAVGPGHTRRLPGSLTPEALDDGVDLAATLAQGRPVRRPGWLAQGRGGLAVIPSLARLTSETAFRLRRALDDGETALLAFEDDEDEGADPGLLDRLGLVLHLPVPPRGVPPIRLRRREVEAARRRLRRVGIDDAALEAIASAGAALGVASSRATLHAVRAARAAAALAGRLQVELDDLRLAARLALAPRAQHPPAEVRDAPPSATERPEPPQPAGASPRDGEVAKGEEIASHTSETLTAALLRAAELDVVDGLGGGAHPPGRNSGPARGRFGAPRRAARGRPAGVMTRRPRAGERLDLAATLRAAAPWRRLRDPHGGLGAPLPIRLSDLRTVRRVAPERTATLFAVDASGSAAAERLGEAKGAVERLLARCYARRDEVALVSFRGDGAEVRLPPTRSLVRVRRDLAALPGGGGTPLAAGLEAIGALADGVRRRGLRPQLVLLTDGRANVARNGGGGRAAALADAHAAARVLRASGLAATVVDTSARGDGRTAELAAALGARRLHLPRVGGEGLARALDPSAGGGGAGHGAR